MSRRRIISAAAGMAVFLASALTAPAARAGKAPGAMQSDTPDFNGVYYPYNPATAGRGGGGRGAAQSGEPLPPPTRSAPTGDLSNGRSPDAPKLAPEYMEKWNVIRESRMAGSYEYDNIANCLPPGMPAMMGMAYGMEVMQTEDKITFFSEWQDALRRVFLDGRQPSEEVLDDPTYAGYSTGHWEGDTLVVETVALSSKSFIDNSSPHSEEMTITERIRFIDTDILEDRITVVDPVALLEPWEITHTYRKAYPPNDELREFACAEGLRDSPF